MSQVCTDSLGEQSAVRTVQLQHGFVAAAVHSRMRYRHRPAHVRSASHERELAEIPGNIDNSRALFAERDRLHGWPRFADAEQIGTIADLPRCAAAYEYGIRAGRWQCRCR